MPVFPLVAGTKHQPHIKAWQEKATTDLEKVRAWWRRWPNANAGIAVGVVGVVGVLVVDLDRGHAEGVDGVNNWHDLGLPDIPGATVLTPSGGQHLYFRIPDGQPITGRPGGIAPGVDLRSDRNQVVAPGGRRADGMSLLGPGGHLPRPEDLPAASAALLELARAPKGHGSPAATTSVPTGIDGPLRNSPAGLGQRVAQPLGQAGMGAALQQILHAVATAPEGTRNSTLNEQTFAAGQIFEPSTGAGWVQHALRFAARANGLVDAEIESVVPRAFAVGAANPRALAPTDPPAAGAFEPLDLAAWLAEDHPAPAHVDSGGVLYEGGFTLLAGEPESGKSVLAYGWALDVLRSGRRVVLLDEEAGPLDALGKFRALGAADEELAAGLVYLPPRGRNLIEQTGAWAAMVRAASPGLVVVDSFAAALANSGMDENSNADVTRFVNKVLLPVTQQVGAGLVVIDHKTKAAADSRYSRGASAKLGLTDLAVNVRATQPFSRDRSGSVEVRVTKDRWGDFGRDATWSVTVGTGGGRIVLSFLQLSESELHDRAAESRSEVADLQMAQVLAAVGAAGPEGLSVAAVGRALRGTDEKKGMGSNTVRRLVDQAERDGRLVRGGRKVAGTFSLVLPKPDEATLSGGVW